MFGHSFFKSGEGGTEASCRMGPSSLKEGLVASRLRGELVVGALCVQKRCTLVQTAGGALVVRVVLLERRSNAFIQTAGGSHVVWALFV